MSNKPPKTETPTDADLKGNPGIGQSKGPTGHDIEGEVENEPRVDGGIDPNHRGRDHA